MQEAYPINPEVAPLGICFLGIIVVISLITLIITLMIFCKIFSKAGYGWAMGLLVLIPIIGHLIALFVLAFGNWPIECELQALKHAQSASPPPGQPHDSFRNV